MNISYYKQTPQLMKEFFYSPDFPDNKINEYHKLVCDESLFALLDCLVFDLPKIKKITTPILVLGGERDYTVTPREVHLTAKAYNTTAKIFPAMAHNMMLEAGWKDVADYIINWLNKQKL